MPRQTRDTELPKPPAPPLDWAKIAESGKVWEFVEGEDFEGKVGGFRSRKKTEARKAGFDFEYREVQRDGKVVLKFKAFPLADSNGAGASSAASAETPGEKREKGSESDPEREREAQLP